MLQIDNLVFNGWGRRFFDKATVTLPPGTKVGLVGRNGVGKSTLFKLILGELQPDGGEIAFPKTARIASVVVMGKEDASQQSLSLDVDASKCPDCKGAGYWYPGGYDKGVAKCKHSKLVG